MKKMLKLTKLFFVTLLASVLLFSCQKDDTELNVTPQTNLVSEQTVYDIAVNFIPENETEKSEKIAKKVKNIKIIKTKKSENAFYIVNYETSGFIIVSADNRTIPILAFSEKNSFPTDESYPNNVKFWIENSKKQIEYVIENNLPQSEEIKEAWALVQYEDDEDNGGIDDGDDGGVDGGTSSCTYYSSWREYGPYLETNWNQGCGYNNFSPTSSDVGCDLLPCDRAYTGCVATAMAQVMRYHEYPDNYNWDIMPIRAVYPFNSTENNEISQLMRDAGDAVDMNWLCIGSAAYTSKVASAMNNIFNYQDVKYTSFLGYLVYRETAIKDQPVILSGGGHAWVCDGLKIYDVRYSNCMEYTIYQYHMNWGWGGVYNGYYADDYFINDVGNFNSNLNIVYNIYKPY